MIKRIDYHSKNIQLLIIFSILSLLTLSLSIFSKKPQNNSLLRQESIQNTPKEPERNVYLGFWTYGLWDDTTRSLNPAKLESLEGEIGKKVAIAHFFRGWQFLEQSSIVTDIHTLQSHGWRPMVSANPYFFADCPVNGMNLYKAIASGNCDPLLHRIGQNFRQINGPFFFRFAWEANVHSIEWSINYTRSAPGDYINAWKRFHDIVKQEGATNVLWVYAPQVETPTSDKIAALYPGNDYVDWIALDGYNWGETQSWSNWQEFKVVYLSSYNIVKALAPQKPFMISEVNSTDVGGDKAKWFQDMLEVEIPNTFKGVDAIVFFNENKTAKEGVNWTIESNPKSLDAFKRAIQNPIYKSTF